VAFLGATALVAPEYGRRISRVAAREQHSEGALPLIPNIPQHIEVVLVVLAGLVFITLALYLRRFVERKEEHRPRR
jgi:hypothetical protein